MEELNKNIKNEVIEPNKLYDLCNRKNYFTSGDVAQYDKLFEHNKAPGATTWELALIIWICTPQYSKEEIYNELLKIKHKLN